MRMPTHASRLALLLALAGAAAAAAQPDRFVVPLSRPGQPAKLTVKLVHGDIAVESHAGQEVIVEARAEEDGRHRRSPQPGAGGPGGAGERGMRRLPNRSLGLTIEEEDNEVRVSLGGPPRAGSVRVLVPRQTALDLGTVNDGDVRVRGVEGDLELRNTNGDVIAEEVAGSVVAHTVNGEVRVTLSRVTPNAAMAFSTLNGDVDVTLPAGTRASLRLRSENGEILTDFDVQLAAAPATVEQRRSGGRYRIELERDVRGTINGGGPEIQLRSFNGDIYLRKRG